MYLEGYKSLKACKIDVIATDVHLAGRLRDGEVVRLEVLDIPLGSAFLCVLVPNNV